MTPDGQAPTAADLRRAASLFLHRRNSAIKLSVDTSRNGLVATPIDSVELSRVHADVSRVEIASDDQRFNFPSKHQEHQPSPEAETSTISRANTFGLWGWRGLEHATNGL